MRHLRNLQLLREMMGTVDSFYEGVLTLGQVADKLLILRDSLTFFDREWLQDFTQHIVTLDSAFVEPPTRGNEVSVVKVAVDTALQEIKKLLQEKLSGISLSRNSK